MAAGAAPRLPGRLSETRCEHAVTSTGNVTVYSPVAVCEDVTLVVPRARVPSVLTTAHMMRRLHVTPPPARTDVIALPLAHVPLTRRCSRADVRPSRKSALRLRTFVAL